MGTGGHGPSHLGIAARASARFPARRNVVLTRSPVICPGRRARRLARRRSRSAPSARPERLRQRRRRDRRAALPLADDLRAHRDRRRCRRRHVLPAVRARLDFAADVAGAARLGESGVSLLVRHVRTAGDIDRDVGITAAGGARRGRCPLRPGRDRVLALRRLGGRLLRGLDHAASRRRRHRGLAATTFRGSPRSSRTTAGATIRRRTTTEALATSAGRFGSSSRTSSATATGGSPRPSATSAGAIGPRVRSPTTSASCAGCARVSSASQRSRAGSRPLADDPEDAAKDRADFGVLS